MCQNRTACGTCPSCPRQPRFPVSKLSRAPNCFPHIIASTLPCALSGAPLAPHIYKKFTILTKYLPPPNARARPIFLISNIQPFCLPDQPFCSNPLNASVFTHFHYHTLTHVPLFNSASPSLFLQITQSYRIIKLIWLTLPRNES